MKNLKSKEEALVLMFQSIMVGSFNISSRDHRVFKKLLMADRVVTTNQIKLIDLLIDKYGKGLRKNGYDPEALKALPWTSTKVVETDQRYLTAQVSLVGDRLLIYAPYSKKLEKGGLRKIKQTFEWDSEAKKFAGKFTTHKLKWLLGLLRECFPAGIILSDELTAILNQAESFKAIYDPTLVQINGNFLIAAHNESLEKAISDIILNDHHSTLSKLVKYGVKIDQSVHRDDEVLKIASQLNYHIDPSDLYRTVQALKQMGISKFLIYHDFDSPYEIRKMMHDYSTELGVTVDFTSILDEIAIEDISDAPDTVLIMKKVSWLSDNIFVNKYYKVITIQNDNSKNSSAR